MNYRSHYSTKVDMTSQLDPIPEKEKLMAKNSAGGFSFTIDNWKRLERFIFLGSERGTYYINEKNLTIENAKAVEYCIKENGPKVVDLVAQISKEGKAPKNEPALFVLAMCAGLGDEHTKQYALSMLNTVARTGTHLFHFVEYVEGFRGWGRSLRRAVTNWYQCQSTPSVILQLIKYQQRDGWSHRDLLRLCHFKTADPIRNSLYNWVTNRDDKKRFDILDQNSVLDSVRAMKDLKNLSPSHTNDIKQACDLIRNLKLPREVIPTNLLNNADIWQTLLQDMPMTAMIRNLGKMTAVGLLAPMSEAVNIVVSRLTDSKYVQKSKIHPLQLLIALKTYEQGKGDKGKLSWNSVPQIIDALNKAFYSSFSNVESSGKRIFLSLDVSGSMDWHSIAGMSITPMQASAALALITAATEPNYHIMAFSNTLVPINISPQQRLDDVLKTMKNIQMGTTDCAQPILHALEKKIPVDTFVIYTDSETYAGDIHPIQALQEYRKVMNIPAKLIVVGMQSNGFTIADPEDAGMFDIAGFSTDTPAIISNFSKS